MPNVKLVIEYDGSYFHGWQKQPGVRSVQESLQDALSKVLRQNIRCVYASGRTDAGVHARGQVVSFSVESEPDLRLITIGVSSILKGELAIREASIAPDDFHPQFDAKAKVYSYTIYNATTPPVLDKGRSWFVPFPLDLCAMDRAARMLVGKKDFKSFQGAGSNVSDTTREIFESFIESNIPYIKYTVKGDGFLRQMVRIIVGTLVEIGRGRDIDIGEVIEARDRRKAGPTAPPWGLTLQRVIY